MLVPLILLAASISPAHASTPPASASASSFQPVGSVTARATVSIRVIAGVSFGPSHASGTAGASRTSTALSDAAGLMRPAELLEFQ
jgi:hypothetical protein